MAIINKLVSFASRYTDDIAKCAKASWLTPACIKTGEIKGLKLAPELLEDTIKLSETSTFIKQLTSKFKQTLVRVKLVLHPKSKTSKAYLLGTDNEVVYPKGQQFELIDKELIEYINPKTKMGCQRYEVHLQEV